MCNAWRPFDLAWLRREVLPSTVGGGEEARISGGERQPAAIDRNDVEIAVTQAVDPGDKPKSGSWLIANRAGPGRFGRHEHRTA
jgi:hypothetical protein